MWELSHVIYKVSHSLIIIMFFLLRWLINIHIFKGLIFSHICFLMLHFEAFLLDNMFISLVTDYIFLDTVECKIIQWHINPPSRILSSQYYAYVFTVSFSGVIFIVFWAFYQHWLNMSWWWDLVTKLSWKLCLY